MLDRLKAWHPFQTPDTQRLAVLFAVVYFAQGMWSLPVLPLTFVLKGWGLSAGQVATFFSISVIPWLVKPVYGLISDFLPLAGYRRKSYLLLTSGLAATAGLALGLFVEHSYWELAIFFTAMGLGLAFTDVLVDALMVENGKPRGLTGAFQSVQWASINLASILVGLLGGYLARQRNLHAAFLIAAGFPLISFVMTLFFIREQRARMDLAGFRHTLRAVRAALAQRDVWIVAGFILFWTFSPSFGPALVYYQTDVLKFSEQFIGLLSSLGSAAGIVGAFFYAPLSRRVPLVRIINISIGVGVAGTLAYLVYRDVWSALIIDTVFGGVGMIVQLAFLDLAAKSCPRHVEATFFALLMSVYNLGTQGSQVAGGYLYDGLGFVALVLISSAMTAMAWLLVPLVKIHRIEARARAATEVEATM